jgi:hypothetical protein
VNRLIREQMHVCVWRGVCARAVDARVTLREQVFATQWPMTFVTALAWTRARLTTSSMSTLAESHGAADSLVQSSETFHPGGKAENSVDESPRESQLKRPVLRSA